MSSVGSDNVAFWAARDPGASSDTVVAEIVDGLHRARFRDMTRVDMGADGAEGGILGPRYLDRRWWKWKLRAHKDTKI